MKHDKEFKISSLSIKNNTTVILLTLIIFCFGIFSYINMPKESFPEIIVPQIYISTSYPGNSPEEIEKLITDPIEQNLNTISGVKEISSTSMQDHSSISVEFDKNISVSEALRRVKDKVDETVAEVDFPKDLPQKPKAFELNISEMSPILNINLYGDMSVLEIEKYAEYLKENIELLPEIYKVEIDGVQEKEVEIKIDLYKMESMNISFDDVERAIASENVNISGGNLKINALIRNIKLKKEFKDVDDIKGIIVKKTKKKNVIYLKDIAKVSFKERERENYARAFLKPVVMVNVYKRGGKNIIDVTQKIKDIISDMKKTIFPRYLNVLVTNDTSKDIENDLSNLENSIMFGVILVILVLMFFLNIRNALFVGIAIPLSMFLSFILLNSFGVTLNMMVLFALIIALGMLVDNGIVVVENIYRLMEEGLSPIRASMLGVGEVAIPIIVSTLTTLLVFIPLAFWPGMIGEFMKYLPITLISVLSSSLFVALVINPVLTYKYMKLDNPKKHSRKSKYSIYFIIFGFILGFIGHIVINSKFITSLANIFLIIGIFRFAYNLFIRKSIFWFKNTGILRLENIYEKILVITFKGKNIYKFLLGIWMVLLFSIVLLVVFPPKVIFFPNNEPKQIMISIETEINTDVSKTNEISKKIEKIIYEYIRKYENGSGYNTMVKSIISQVGKNAEAQQGEGSGNKKTPHKAKITLNLRDFHDRPISSFDMMKNLRKLIKNQKLPSVKVTISKDQMGPPVGYAIDIELKGKDYLKLYKTSLELKKFINNTDIKGIEDLKISVNELQELYLDIDREKSRKLGLSSSLIGGSLRTSIYGKEVSKYKRDLDDKKYPINIRLQDKFRYNITNLMNQRIIVRDNQTGSITKVPLASISKINTRSNIDLIKRKNLLKVVNVQSNLIEGYNANKVVEEIKKSIVKFDYPKDIKISFGGEQQKQSEEMQFLSKAFFIGVIMIFLLLVTQFNSIWNPFIILSTVILSLIGVFLGLFISQMDFVIIMTTIGIISLAGIVVNNAIVLIDYTNLVLNRKVKELNINTNSIPKKVIYESIMQAGKKRLRPVLLTAITTVLGMLPLASGFNINFFTLISEYDPQLSIGGDNVIFWGPIAWSVIFGLSVSTFLTLIVVPLMYFLISKKV